MRKNRKIRIFLSGIVNSTNAQNLNCRALMRYLDSAKFEVRALTVYSGNLGLPEFACAATPVDAESPGTPKLCEGDSPCQNKDGKPPQLTRWGHRVYDGHGSRLASLFYSTPKSFYPIHYPARIWHAIQLVRGIFWCDVAYLCKPEHWKLQRFVCRVLRKRTLGTIEIVWREGSSAEDGPWSNWRTRTYAITKSMIDKNAAVIGLPKPDGVLYLGTDYDEFSDATPKAALSDVVLIGADLKRKGIDDYLDLAARFPQLSFHVAGGGVGEIDYAAQCEAAGLKNVVFHGSLSHTQLAELLKGIQLHVFPSRAEGFPKVTLETAAAGVPSVVYDDYGADEWITHGKNGFVVKTVDEMAACIQEILDYPEKLQPMADDARAMAKSFDWKVRVKDWERVIEELALG